MNLIGVAARKWRLAVSRHTQIHVALLNEGVDVWRRVRAENVRENVYRILTQTYDASIETCQFEPGDEVYCEVIENCGRRILAARSRARPP